ncbi:hypothetical protein JB92DRAFT_2829320, partial [Gautieria morchelliformis]
ANRAGGQSAVRVSESRLSSPGRAAHTGSGTVWYDTDRSQSAEVDSGAGGMSTRSVLQIAVSSHAPGTAVPISGTPCSGVIASVQVLPRLGNVRAIPLVAWWSQRHTPGSSSSPRGTSGSVAAVTLDGRRDPSQTHCSSGKLPIPPLDHENIGRQGIDTHASTLEGAHEGVPLQVLASQATPTWGLRVMHRGLGPPSRGTRVPKGNTRSSLNPGPNHRDQRESNLIGPFGQLRPQVSSETIVQPDIARLGRHIETTPILSPDVVVKEVQSAKDLPKLKNRSFHDSRLGPKLKNLTRLGWDMDPFVVVSFGKKVFRTRVIRHSLNPTWDEKLWFHVRRYESNFKIGTSRETVDSFLTRHGKPIDGELSFDEVVMCLEQELVHPRSEKKRISDDNAPHFDSLNFPGPLLQQVPHLGGGPGVTGGSLATSDTHQSSVSSSEAEDSSGKSDDVVEHPGTAQMVHQSHYEGVKWRVPAGSENSVKIIVQNRMTGQLEEEKMQVYVRLGIRLLVRQVEWKAIEVLHVAHG